MMICRSGDAEAAYEASDVIGRGSFGTIYRAEDLLQPGRRVALKAVPCRRKSAAREAQEEASMLLKLRHPYVIRCREWFYDAEGSATGKLWIVLDLMEGGDLLQLYESRRQALAGPPDASFVRHVIASLSSALDYIHGQGIIHRDVKCANVLLSQDREHLALGDFGLACQVEEASTDPMPIQALGTPSYMPPEIICGRPHSTASDAWCLGVISFKLAALRRPFEARDDVTLSMKIVNSEPGSLPPDTAADVSCATLGLLLKDACKRLRPADAYKLTHEAPIASLSRLAMQEKIPYRLSRL